MRKFIITFILIVTLSSASFAEMLTLEEAISAGLNNNYNIRLQRNTNQQSQNNVAMATGYLLPQVGLNGGVNYTNTDDLLDTESSSGMAGDNDVVATSAGASLSWTLFDGLRMFRARGIIYDQAEQGAVQERMEVEESVLDIIRAYYAVVGNKKALSVREDQVEVSQSRYDRAKVGFEMGSVIGRELLSSEVALNNDKSSLEDAKYRYEASKYQLNVLLARDVSTEYNVIDSIDYIKLNYEKDDIYKIALNQNATLLNLNLNADIAKKMLGVEKSKFAPMLIASGSYGYNNSNVEYETASAETENLKGSVGLNLTWNIFNGFSDRSAVLNSKIDVNNTEISQEMFKTQLKAQIYNKWMEYLNYKNKKEYDSHSVNASEKNLAISTELFRNGSLTDVQFRQAQIELSNAKYNLIVTEYKLRIIIAELQKLAGIMEIK